MGKVKELMDTPRLRASKHCCEEASFGSKMFYIPCNKPASRMIDNGDAQTYRMCLACADHNVKNRGATDLGPYDKGK